jgi:hypothetical protein
LTRLVQLAGQGRIGIQQGALLADWLEDEAPDDRDHTHEQLDLLSDVVRYHESQGSLDRRREISRKAYTRARRLIAEINRSLPLADTCAWLTAVHDHPSASSWRLLGAAIALEKGRESASERLREQLVALTPRAARPFLQLGLWALEQAAGDFRQAARTRGEILREVKDLPDQMARREVRELLKESPGLVCAYAANKLRHFASYDPELRAALGASRRS